MLKVLVWIYRWLAKSARTLDIWGCDKKVVDEETTARDITIGQNLLFVLSIALIATAFYLCMRGCDLLATICILVWFVGFIVLWKKGEKITVTIDKTLKAEPEVEVESVVEWWFPGYCDLCFAVNNEESLVNGKYDNEVTKDVDYAGSVGTSPLFSDGFVVVGGKTDIELTTFKAEDLGTITVSTIIPEYISEACLKMMDESIANMKKGVVSEPIDLSGIEGGE